MQTIKTEAAPKIVHNLAYQPWDWILSTGVYVDDIDAAFRAALSSCGIGRVRWRDEEIEIALSRSLFPSRGHQLRRALVVLPENA